LRQARRFVEATGKQAPGSRRIVEPIRCRTLSATRPTFGTRTITVPITQISRTSDAILLETELSEFLFKNKK
jgi:hypothetical protein